MNSTTQLQKQNREVAITIKLEPLCIISSNNQKAEASKADFDSLFLEAVDSAFSILGDSNKQALYLHLKKTFNIRKETIPQDIQKFTNILEQVFGKSALLLEAKIIEILHSKVPRFRFSPKEGKLSFITYLESLRGSL